MYMHATKEQKCLQTGPTSISVRLTHMFHLLRSFTEELGEGDQGGLWGERRDGIRLQNQEEIVKLLVWTQA